MNINTFGGRKFVVVLLCQAATTWLTYRGSIDGGVFMSVTIAVAAAYITGNVAQKKVQP